jgi:hypothetical protein
VLFHLFCRVFKNNVPLLLKGEVKHQILTTLVKELVRSLDSEVIIYNIQCFSLCCGLYIAFVDLIWRKLFEWELSIRLDIKQLEGEKIIKYYL